MQSRRTAWIVAGLALMWGSLVEAQSRPAAPAAAEKGAAVANHARGEFEVKLKPFAVEAAPDPSFGHMAIDKQFHGDIEGSSKGEMMASNSPQGSGSYVALERVTATLRGRSGSFVLVHQGSMTRGADFKLNISVVPESGTGQLAGLSGQLTITITEGKHFYDFEYSLPDAP